MSTNLNVLDGNLLPQAVAAMLDDDGSLIMVRTSEHRKNTFRYAGNFSPVATPTDVLLIQGSATKTLRIKRIALGGIATANGNMPVSLVRRSAAPTGGTLAAIAGGAHDAVNDGAATGVVSKFTANATSVGTAVATIGQGRVFFITTATGGPPAPLVWEFATRQDKAFILRGSSDYLAINLGGGALTAGAVLDFEIELEEDAS